MRSRMTLERGKNQAQLTARQIMTFRPPKITNPAAGVWNCVPTPIQHADSPVLVSMWLPDPALPVDDVTRPALNYVGQHLLKHFPQGY